MTNTYYFSGPYAKTPVKGESVQGRVYTENCIPGHPPLCDYTFKGIFVGECADGFMVRPTWRSDGGELETIFCRSLHPCPDQVCTEAAPNMITAKSEDPAPYAVTPASKSRHEEDQVIAEALRILTGRIKMGTVLDTPQTVRSYLVCKHAGLKREVFDVIFCDAQHRIIEHETMFVGTLTQVSVYSREVVRRALELNAAAVILSHNHPSGHPEPSNADVNLTQTLKAALALVDVRVLDHFITGAGTCTSMAEKGQV